MTIKPLPFEKDIQESENILEMVCEIENENEEANNFDWSCSFGSEDDITKIITNKILPKIDFYNIDYIAQHGKPVFYWCGILCAYPYFEDFYTQNLEEEEILDLIVKYHLFYENSKIVFHNNTKSPLYRFFLKYKDGAGLNIPSDIGSIISKVEKIIKLEFEKNMESWATWEENTNDEDEEDFEDTED